MAERRKQRVPADMFVTRDLSRPIQYVNAPW